MPPEKDASVRLIHTSLVDQSEATYVKYLVTMQIVCAWSRRWVLRSYNSCLFSGEVREPPTDD